jgi:hypothetical protein
VPTGQRGTSKLDMIASGHAYTRFKRAGCEPMASPTCNLLPKNAHRTNQTGCFGPFPFCVGVVPAPS